MQAVGKYKLVPFLHAVPQTPPCLWGVDAMLKQRLSKDSWDPGAAYHDRIKKTWHQPGSSLTPASTHLTKIINHPGS
jgi:hypothetical protein